MGELIVNGIKWAFLISISLAFMTAITTIVNLIISVVFANVVGEVLGVISACLPFDACSVFASLASSCAAILSFMIAKKIWELVGARFSV